MLPSDSHYELLEVPPTASFEDIRRANRRIRDIYGAESIAISGLYDPVSLEAVHRRLDLAYTTLMDAAKRKDYDHELFPDGVPMPVQQFDRIIDVAAAAAAAKGVSRDAARSTADARDQRAHRVLRPAARQPRSDRRRAARDCGEVEDQHGVLARARRRECSRSYRRAVYVRGFLAEYARALGLDAERVKQTYLGRYRASRAARVEHDDEATK